MVVDVMIYVAYFKGQVTQADSLSDMYSEAQLCIEADTEEYEHIKKNIKKFMGDTQVLEAHIKLAILEGKTIRLSGEAKDMCFSVGEFITKLESRQVKL